MEELMNMDFTGIDIELPEEVDEALDDLFDDIMDLIIDTATYLYGPDCTPEDYENAGQVLMLAWVKKAENLRNRYDRNQD